jgi:hypothetical protein
VHLQTSLVQSFVLLFQNFEEVVQIIALKRFGCAPHYNQLAPLQTAVENASFQRIIIKIDMKNVAFI